MKKHSVVHKNHENIRRCHYFNNRKNCPFEELGCMFKHEYAPKCRYKDRCKIKYCQFQHEVKEKANEIFENHGSLNNTSEYSFVEPADEDDEIVYEEE